MNQGFFVVGKRTLSTNHYMREQLKQRHPTSDMYMIGCGAEAGMLFHRKQACMYAGQSKWIAYLINACSNCEEESVLHSGDKFGINMLTFFVDKRKARKAKEVIHSG